MNVFYPYKTEIAVDKSLHLTLPSVHLLANIFLYRLLPLFIIVSMMATFCLELIDATWSSVLVLIMLSVISFILLKSEIILQFSIKSNSIEIKILGLIFQKKVLVAVQDIAYIELSVSTLSKESGALYHMILKNGKRVLLVRFPVAINNNMSKFAAINNSIHELTQLNIRTIESNHIFVAPPQ